MSNDSKTHAYKWGKEDGLEGDDIWAPSQGWKSNDEAKYDKGYKKGQIKRMTKLLTGDLDEDTED